MRVSANRELPCSVGEDEVTFFMIAFECGVKLPLAAFVRQFLSKLPLDPFQLSPAFWENLLALCIMWHRIHGCDPSMAELWACFRLRSPYKTSGMYYLYNTGKMTLKMTYRGKN